ncbi:MAG: hypothetical protein K9J84_03110, partial [Bacteroidia bacterium]|nr:hypothetical protein [Bacteroidia bacterium]
MTKLKALLLFFISLFLLVWPPKQTNSCGFYILQEEYRFWSFDPSNNAVAGMHPFFYSMELYHNGFDIENRFYVNEINTNSIDEYEQNMDQWLKYIYKVDPNAKVIKDDIYEVLYEINPIDYFAILDGLKKENSFVEFASKYPSVLEYLSYAKKSEYQSNYKDGWICESCPELVSPGNFKPGDRYFSNYNVNPDPNNGMELIENGLKYLTKEKDKFLQERFAFQIVRLAYYNLDSLNLNEAYLKYLEPLTDQNWLKGAANMYHVLNLTGPKRNLGLARIFDACPDKRYRCQQLFQNDLFDETVELANNNHERMLLEVIHSISNPNEQLQIIKKIGRFEPNSKYLPALWVREINKLEDWILGPLYSDFGSTKNDHMRYESEIRNAVQSQLTKDKKYALEVAQYLENSNSLVSSSSKSFHHLCLGYLYFILKDLNKAEENYSKVIPNELDEIGKVQFSLNQFMLHLSQTQKVTPQLESDLANCLQLLVQTETKYPQRKMMKFQLINFAAKEFFDRGERAKGLLLFGFSAKPYASHSLLGIGNMYTQIYSLAEPKDIDEMLFVLSKRNPNSLEKYIQTHKVYSYTYDYGDNMEFINKNKLLDLKSMLLVQTDKLLEAHAA